AWKSPHASRNKSFARFSKSCQCFGGSSWSWWSCSISIRGTRVFLAILPGRHPRTPAAPAGSRLVAWGERLRRLLEEERTQLGQSLAGLGGSQPLERPHALDPVEAVAPLGHDRADAADGLLADQVLGHAQRGGRLAGHEDVGYARRPVE